MNGVYSIVLVLVYFKSFCYWDIDLVLTLPGVGAINFISAQGEGEGKKGQKTACILITNALRIKTRWSRKFSRPSK